MEHMVYTLIDHRNDVIKCSKTQVVEPRAAGEWFHSKVLSNLWCHFYKSADHGKLSVVDLFFTMTFIFCFPRSFSQTARSDVFFCCFSYFFFVFLQLQAPTHCQKCLPMCWDLVLLCPCWGVKLFLWKTKTKTTGTAWHVTSFPWSILS